MDFKEVSKNVWEFKEEGMNVPLRVVAGRSLLDKMQSDRTIKQAVNVSKLPGLVGSVFVMPDGHEGYGFPIGGVAGFEEGGVVSPGGVGYDINCLPAGAKILTEFGFVRLVESFERDFIKVQEGGFGSFTLFLSLTAPLVLSVADKKLCVSKPVAFMKKKASSVVVIQTESGLELEATLEHPVMTRRSMVEVGKIKPGEEVAVSFFKGVEFDEQLPLGFSSVEEAAIYSRLIGYFFGDGVLAICGGEMCAIAYGEKDDLIKMQFDVSRLGFHSKIFTRARKHGVASQYGEKRFKSAIFELRVYSKEFCEKLLSLGVPLGSKTENSFRVPLWVVKGSRWVKRLFLAGFLGGEFSSTFTRSKTSFNTPVIYQNKNRDFVEDGRLFLMDISLLLKDFGVECVRIAQREVYTNKKGRVRLGLEISASEDNLLRLWQLIGFEYNEKRRVFAEIACKYILLKKRLNKERQIAVQKAREMRGQGFSLKEVQSVLCSENINPRFLERCYYGEARRRIPFSMISFNDFMKKEVADIEEYGVLFEKVASVKKISRECEVFDFTIAETHNFIANGFVVSNCGVRLVSTGLSVEEVKPKLKELVDGFYSNIPVGVGSKGKIHLKSSELDEVLVQGAGWAVEKGLGDKRDLKFCEEEGRMSGADPSKVSSLAKQRGGPQLGTLGSGNHFLEVQVIEKVFDERTAKKFGVEEGMVSVMVHTGSRGLGHQVCEDYVRKMLSVEQKYKLSLPDNELACAPIGSEEADDYFKAMNSAVNYAFCNRQIITSWVRGVFYKMFPQADLKVVYDVAHNIAKFEEHEVNGEKKNICVHRKGATRAFWKGRKEIPLEYRSIGQPVLIPGSMNTSSYLLLGLEGARQTFGSSCHGAGRVMSRHEALRTFEGGALKKSMEEKGQIVRAPSLKGLAEEAGGAYKNVDEVVKSVEDAGISRIIAKMSPIGVIKG